MAPPLPSIASAAEGAALFGDFAGTMGESDFLWPYLIDYRFELVDANRPGRTFPYGQPEDLPVPVQMASTRAKGLGPRRAGLALAIAPQPVLPSAFLHSVGTLDVNFSRLNTLPACSPVNASPTPLRMPTHDSGPS